MVRTIITVMDARHHRATHAAPPTPISASHRVKWQPVLHARELVCNTTDWDQRVCTARTKLSNGPATTAHPQHKTCAFGFARAPEGTTAGRTVAPTPQRSPTLNKANQCSRSAAPSIGRPPRKASTTTADKTAAGAAFRAMRCKRQKTQMRRLPTSTHWHRRPLPKTENIVGHLANSHLMTSIEHVSWQQLCSAGSPLHSFLVLLCAASQTGVGRVSRLRQTPHLAKTLPPKAPHVCRVQFHLCALVPVCGSLHPHPPR